MSERFGPLWASLMYEDAHAGIRFLEEALGFERGMVLSRDDEPSQVMHAEMWWPTGGGVMLGTAGLDDTVFGGRPTGVGSVYLVSNEPDALYQRARDAGARVVIELHDTDFGSRTFTVADSEGNLWTVGTYSGT
jgi:uncharacterized glyoxalase superfamily protein PhnB